MKFSIKSFFVFGGFLVLAVSIPVTVYLVRQRQEIRSKAEVEVASCPNKLIFGLNGTLPSPEKIKQLFTQPSIGFIAAAWKSFQPTQGSAYNFTVLDREVDAVISEGRTPAIKFCDGDCFPDWAREANASGEYCCANDYVCRVLRDEETVTQAFQNIVRAMVTRYKDRIKQWDYGIEPNCRGYNPIRYTRWLKRFSDAVRAADPTAVIIAGHLSGTPRDYLSTMYDQGAGPYFDRLALDPYGDPLDTNGLEAVRRLMEERGEGYKKIWLGEWGIRSGNDEQRQANLIGQGLDYLASKPWIESAFYHHFECELTKPNCVPGDPEYLGFGFLRGDGTEKPSYNVFKTRTDACSVPPLTPTPRPTNTPTPLPTRTPTLTQIPLVGDIDRDGDVDIFDYNILVSHFGPRMPPGSPADLDHDGDVDIFDYNLLVGNFGQRGE